MVPDHIHTPNDGRGYREVYVDGRKVERAFFADVKRGIVDFYPLPLRADKHRKRVISKRLRGKVEVRQKNG